MTNFAVVIVAILYLTIKAVMLIMATKAEMSLLSVLIKILYMVLTAMTIWVVIEI